MPATHGAGIRSPFDVQGLFGGSKKLVQRFTLDTTPPAHVKVKAWLPRQHAGENILCWLLPLCFVLCWAQISRLHTVLVAKRGDWAKANKRLWAFWGPRGARVHRGLPALLELGSESEAEVCLQRQALSLPRSSGLAEGTAFPGRRRAIWPPHGGQSTVCLGLF